jgi:hypothetical protein
MIIKLNTIHYCALSILLLALGTSLSAYAGEAPPPPSFFGDLVWADQNNNQLQDPGEPGLLSVTVNICGASDLSTIDCSFYSDSTSTDTNGDYLFTDIGFDDYYNVWIDLSTLPAGASATTPTSLFFDNSSDQLSGLDILTADFGFQILEAVVPVPAAIWLFGSGLLAFLGVARRKHAMK